MLGVFKMDSLVNVTNLRKYYQVKSGLFGRSLNYIKALDGVTFQINAGETFGLVGESGSGKTTLGRCLLRLIEPTTGDIYFEGENITMLRGKALKPFRRYMQAVFQNPFQSLNPRMSTAYIISEPLKIHTRMSEEEIKCRTLELLRLVGLGEEQLYKYPHELSGGQAQRVAIARAIALKPKFIILDEPTSALDVSIQAQILNLLEDLNNKFNLTFFFISHDLSVVQHISDKVAVIYLGRIVELGESMELFTKPLHPYTNALISQVPKLDLKIAGSKKKISIKDEIPNPMMPPSGCKFHPRCLYSKEKCMQEEPQLEKVGDRLVRCWLHKR